MESKPENKADNRTENRDKTPKGPRKRVQIAIAAIIVATGIAAAIGLKVSRKPPATQPKPAPVPLVEIQQVSPRDIKMMVEGFGTVEPTIETEVVPQVSGKVVRVHPNYRNGGYIQADQAVIVIDKRDYELAVQTAEAEVAQAQVNLELEIAEAEVAREEWQQLNPGQTPTSPLVFREPQIKQAQTRLEAAKANLATAKLQLERTEVTVPFDCRVSSETVDLGQYVTVGKVIGTVYGIDTMEIAVPLEDRELQWFDVPVAGADPNSGSVAEVIAEFAGGQYGWQGRVVRIAGEVDPMSRQVSVIVEVPRPFDNSDSKPNLVPGIFVTVQIQGHTLENAAAVPRYALHNRDQIWLINDSRLHIRQVQIARRDDQYVYITEGIEAGDRVITSSLDTVTEGMKVRLSSQQENSNREVHRED